MARVLVPDVPMSIPRVTLTVVISQRSPHRRIRGATPGGSRRASASKTSTGTVLKVNIS